MLSGEPPRVNEPRKHSSLLLLLLTALTLLLAIHDTLALSREHRTRSNLKAAAFSNKLKYILIPAPQCPGRTYCEDVPGYPTELINQELKKNPLLLYHSSVDRVNMAQKSGAANAEALCLSTEKVIYPKSAEGASGQWMYVVNSGNFTQGVRIEVCIQENGSCRVIDGFAQGYKTSCKQKYIFRELSAINLEGKISREYFRFPASCCCHVEFTGA